MSVKEKMQKMNCWPVNQIKRKRFETSTVPILFIIFAQMRQTEKNNFISFLWFSFAKKCIKYSRKFFLMLLSFEMQDEHKVFLWIQTYRRHFNNGGCSATCTEKMLLTDLRNPTTFIFFKIGLYVISERRYAKYLM